MEDIFSDLFAKKGNGYGKFPYIILQGARSTYMQIPIHFLKEGEEGDFDTQPGTHINNVPDAVSEQNITKQIEILHENLLNHTKRIKRKIENDRDIKFQLCLVESKDRAFYLEEDGVKFSKSIPTGGNLITQQNEVLAMNRAHYWTNV